MWNLYSLIFLQTPLKTYNAPYIIYILLGLLSLYAGILLFYLGYTFSAKTLVINMLFALSPHNRILWFFWINFLIGTPPFLLFFAKLFFFGNLLALKWWGLVLLFTSLTILYYYYYLQNLLFVKKQRKNCHLRHISRISTTPFSPLQYWILYFNFSAWMWFPHFCYCWLLLLYVN